MATMRRCLGLVLLTALAAMMVLSVLRPPGAYAGEQWCEDDPLVVITTPGGARVPLYVTKAGLGLEHLPAVQTGTITYATKATGSGTNVSMQVEIPDDQFASHFLTRTSANTGPLSTGTVYAGTSGFSGQPMTLKFRLDVP